MNNYIIATILVGLAVYLFRRGGLVKLALGLIAGFSGVIFFIDDNPVQTLTEKVQKVQELARPAAEKTIDVVQTIVRADGFHHRRPEGWFRDDRPTGINDGDTLIYDAPGAMWKDSIRVMRDHDLVGMDGHYFPPDSEFERAKRLYDRNWVFDGEKVYVREGPFDKIAIVRKNSEWYKENIRYE